MIAWILLFPIVFTATPDIRTGAVQTSLEMAFVSKVVSGQWLVIRAGTPPTTAALAKETDPLFAGDRIELRTGQGQIRIALANGQLRPLSASDSPFLVPELRGGLIAWFGSVMRRQREWFSTTTRSGAISSWRDGVARPVSNSQSEFSIPSATGISTLKGPVMVTAITPSGETATEITREARLDPTTGTLQLPRGTALPRGLYELRPMTRRLDGPIEMLEPSEPAVWQLVADTHEFDQLSAEYGEAVRVTAPWGMAGANEDAQRLLRARLLSLAFP